MSRIAVLRACARVIAFDAVADAAVGCCDRQNTSGDESPVFPPQAPTVPTTGATTPGPQSWPSVLPIITKSPR